LDWEKPNAVKKLELIHRNSELIYSITFPEGKFYKNNVEIDAGIGDASELFIRKRRTVKIDAELKTTELVNTTFLAGYKNSNSKERIMVLNPGQKEYFQNERG